MSKATQKGGLLAELAYLDQAEYIDKQACVQLVKIVEQHFSEPKKAAVKLMAVNTVVKMINAMPEEERTGLKAKMFPDTQAEQSGEVDGDILIGRIGWMVSEISQRRVMTDVELKDIERIKQLLTQQPVQVDEEKIEAIVDMIDFSILPRRWSKKDIELVVWYTAKELLTRQPQKRTVTRVELRTAFNKHCGIIGDTLYLNICNLEDFAEELDIEIVEKDEEQDQPPMDKETAGDMKYHELKDEDRLDEFGRRKL